MRRNVHTKAGRLSNKRMRAKAEIRNPASPDAEKVTE